MSRKTKSVRGEEVDFDLLETKQRIEQNKPRVLEVRQREDFVHTKRRSRGRKAVMDRLRKKNEADTKPETPKKDTASATTTKKSEPKKTSSKSSTKRKIVKKDKE